MSRQSHIKHQPKYRQQHIKYQPMIRHLQYSKLG